MPEGDLSVDTSSLDSSGHTCDGGKHDYRTDECVCDSDGYAVVVVNMSVIVVDMTACNSSGHNYYNSGHDYFSVVD